MAELETRCAARNSRSRCAIRSASVAMRGIGVPPFALPSTSVIRSSVRLLVLPRRHVDDQHPDDLQDVVQVGRRAGRPPAGSAGPRARRQSLRRSQRPLQRARRGPLQTATRCAHSRTFSLLRMTKVSAASTEPEPLQLEACPLPSLSRNEAHPRDRPRLAVRPGRVGKGRTGSSWATRSPTKADHGAGAERLLSGSAPVCGSVPGKELLAAGTLAAAWYPDARARAP